MASLILYDKYLIRHYNNSSSVNFATDTIKVMLVTSSYTPNVNHEFHSDITNEVSGTNYTAGGKTITNLSVNINIGIVSISGDDLEWVQDATGFQDASYAIMYKDTGTSSTSPLIGYIPFNNDLSSIDYPFEIQWNGNILTMNQNNL